MITDNNPLFTLRLKQSLSWWTAGFCFGIKMKQNINEKLFWSKVSIKSDTECWNWKAGKFNNGYGAFAVNKKNRGSHRIAYTLINGDIPKGMFICHKCDNKSCCNPNHLFIGTNSDNMQDMYNKGFGADNSGENNGRHKLSNNEVIEIIHVKNTGLYYHHEIAKIYNVSRQTVDRILKGITWSKVTKINTDVTEGR